LTAFDKKEKNIEL